MDLGGLYELAEALARRRVSGAVSRRPLDIDALLDDPAIRIVVCCGSGGVGKTTTAAALALRAADAGGAVVVLTIDPAAGWPRRWGWRSWATSRAAWPASRDRPTGRAASCTR